LLAGYRTQLVTSDCTYGCPIGSLALELHEPDPGIRALLAVNFAQWTSAIERCLDAARERLPASLDRHRLAEFTLTVMEGAIMQARTYRDVASFDRNVAVLRDHFDMLMDQAKAERVPAQVR
jgi:TetR/AcrR family transcriptional repressor of nem operon